MLVTGNDAFWLDTLQLNSAIEQEFALLFIG